MTEPAQNPSGSEYADAVRAVLERAAQADAAQNAIEEPRRPVLTAAPVVASLAVVFVLVAGWNVRQWRATPEPPSPQETEAALDVSVLAAGQAVETYRREYGAFPASLQELGFPEGMRLVVEGSSFRIVGAQGPFEVDFDSEEGAAAFLAEIEAKVDAGR
jgi:hypothetical protein